LKKTPVPIGVFLFPETGFQLLKWGAYIGPDSTRFAILPSLQLETPTEMANFTTTPKHFTTKI
jgi:hypothetical protein